MKKLVRFRVLKEDFAAGGINLPKGDYDGEISWSEQPVMGFANRVNGPSKVFFKRAPSLAAKQSTTQDLVSIPVDVVAAIKDGKLIVL